MAIKPGLRPSRTMKYHRRYCEQVEDFMARGYSLTAFAGEIGTTHANLMRWSEERTLFAKAVGRGQGLRARLLEDRLLTTQDGGVLAGRVMTLNALKAAAPADRPPRRRSKPAPGHPPDTKTPPPVELPDNGRE